jgi:hypothetical protein
VPKWTPKEVVNKANCVFGYYLREELIELMTSDSLVKNCPSLDSLVPPSSDFTSAAFVTDGMKESFRKGGFSSLPRD